MLNLEQTIQGVKYQFEGYKDIGNITGDNELIVKIYESIANETEVNREKKLIVSNIKSSVSSVARIPNWKRKLKKVDDNLRKKAWYEKGLRRVLKKIYSRRLLEDTVYVRELKKYSDRDFVEACYVSLLRRKPDSEALIAGLNSIRVLDVPKIKIIHDLYWSEECQRQNVSISGLKWPHRIYKGYMLLTKIPILGFVLRRIQTVCAMPRKIYNLKMWNMQLEKEVSENQKQIALLMEQLNK